MTTFVVHYYDGGTEYVDGLRCELKNGKLTIEIPGGKHVTRKNVLWVED